MTDLPVPLSAADCKMLATWIEKQMGKTVKLDRSTALRIAATLRHWAEQ